MNITVTLDAWTDLIQAAGMGEGAIRMLSVTHPDKEMRERCHSMSLKIGALIEKAIKGQTPEAE